MDSIIDLNQLANNIVSQVGAYAASQNRGSGNYSPSAMYMGYPNQQQFLPANGGNGSMLSGLVMLGVAGGVFALIYKALFFKKHSY